jgi:hypothetical protein
MKKTACCLFFLGIIFSFSVSASDDSSKELVRSKEALHWKSLIQATQYSLLPTFAVTAKVLTGQIKKTMPGNGVVSTKQLVKLAKQVGGPALRLQLLLTAFFYMPLTIINQVSLIKKEE